MSKKRPRTHDGAPAPAVADRGTALRKRGLLTLGALVVVAGVVVGRVIHNRAGRHIVFPAPQPPEADAPVTHADFVGAGACGSCHRSEFALWESSTHGRAGARPPNPQSIRGPFDGRPMRFRDAVVTPSTTAEGGFVFSVAQQNRPKVVWRVDAVVGGGYMAGGGTQAAFSNFPDGTLRFLPFDYSQSQHLWFCQLRANRGWVPVTPAIALADCDAWPPTRILGSSERFQTCQQCHGSQIEVTFDSGAKRYDTRFTTLAINCESCHGPGRRHVELARSGKINATADIGMRALTTLTKDQSLEVCFQCHAVKSALKPGYLPGKRLQAHFALKLPMLLDTIYFADGRTRVFAYQEGHLSSDCYLNGSMTCVDCHDPHSQHYRDINDSPLAGRFDDGQCLDCHASKAEPLERHTRHRPASPGSRCVSCHMPYLQEPSVGRQIRYARSDHTIPIPRPAYDTRLGIENACRQCHPDRTAQQLEAQVTAWYGALKPHPAAVAALLAADSVSDAATAARTILSATGRHPLPHPMAEIAGLAQLLRRYTSPDLLALDGETIERLERLAESADPDVQALALATLHLVRGADPKVRRFLASELRTLGPRDNAVRNRWAWILRVRGDASLARGDYESALAAYRKAQELKPGDPAVWRSLGVGYTRLRDYSRAIEHFGRSLALRPRQPQVLVELGFALMQRGALDSAMAAYRQAIAINPWDPAASANLGIAYLRGGALRSAAEALEKAVELNPGLADAHFALASAYAQLGERTRAAAAVERGLEFDPHNTAARRMLEAVRRQ
jgi:tetratricopeptide (TPR) repeat protein